MRTKLLVMLMFSFLMQISCTKDEALEITGPNTDETVNPDATTGTTYYVSTSGNNANAGTSASPWATLAYAVTSVSSGDIIYMQAGTHTIPARITLPLGVSLTGAGDGSVITNTSLTSRINYGPNGSNGDAIINLVSSSVVDGNQSISNLKFDGANLTSSHAIYIMNRHNVKIHNCSFVKFNYCAVVWWAQGTGDGTPPATRLSGSEFYSNTVTDCAGYNSPDNSYYGALYCGGHEGMLIHDNTMIMNGHSAGNQGWPIKFWLWGGMMNGCKIYNNWLEKTDYSVWDFAIESTGEDGMEIYNNTIRGGIDLNKQNYSGKYTYSVWIHDNTIGPPADDPGGMYNAGITLEWGNSHVLVERNLIQHCSPGILFTPRTQAQTDVTIRYNILKYCNSSEYYNEAICMNPGGSVAFNGFNIYNNVMHGSPAGGYAIRFMHNTSSYSGSNFKIINNIVEHFSGGPVYMTNAGGLTSLYIQNNIFYDNGSSNEPTLSGTPANYYYTTPIKTSPLFVTDGSDFKLQSGSPARDAGINVGSTTDYLNTSVPYNIIPDIGAYEYGSTSGIPVYVSSAIASATPSILEMTYNSTLTSIAPAASAFTVTVNSVARTVSSVAISGTKVMLSLSSPVVNGNVVTVAYTKPATNPLQTSTGGQAASIAAQSVTNNVAGAVVIPVYVSSSIASATPSTLEMIYNSTLASIVPAASAFTVTVNSVARTVSSVAISGTKVMLSLSSPVVNGNVVTVAYTKPATNPLQTSTGGQAASITAQAVTNNSIPSSNNPPVIRITSPVNRRFFRAPATITITASAYDIDGSVSKVEFFNGSIKLGEKTAAPYSFVWKNVPRGTYSITAKATDKLSSTTVSTPVLVFVWGWNY